jgi:hypothetical protein
MRYDSEHTLLGRIIAVLASLIIGFLVLYPIILYGRHFLI